LRDRDPELEDPDPEKIHQSKIFFEKYALKSIKRPLKLFLGNYYRGTEFLGLDPELFTGQVGVETDPDQKFRGKFNPDPNNKK
jgi:hypothetical protein